MNTSNLPIARHQFRRYASAATALIFLCGVGYMLWQAWPFILLNSIKWQREINMQLTDLLYQAKAHSVTAGLYLAGFSFIYGALHSVGPGHGKMIVTTYLATHPTKVKVSLVLTVLSAFLQAIVAIALVSILLVFFNSTMREVNSEANHFISLSFYAIGILGVIIVFRCLRQIWQHMRTTPATVHRSHEHEHEHEHDKDGQCGCGHQHIIGADAINQASSLREYLGIIISIGIRPCTGAIMALLFANIVSAYWLGVVSAFLMSIGAALTTSTIALMTLSGKKIVSRYLGANTSHTTSFGAIGLQFVGGILLILMAVLLLQMPTYGMSPILS